MTTFLLGPFLVWLPKVFLGGFLAAAAYLYWLQWKGFYENQTQLRISYNILLVGVLAFRILYSALLTAGQYYVWLQHPLTNFLLHAPLDQKIMQPILGKSFWLFNNPLGYFLFYSWGRFWLNVFVTVLLALAFYLFLRTLKRRRERFFFEGEPELGFLAALIVGWPHMVIFIPLVFLFVILFSLFRLLVLKRQYTTLGIPFLCAAAVTFLFGNVLIDVLQLGVLSI